MGSTDVDSHNKICIIRRMKTIFLLIFLLLLNCGLSPEARAKSILEKGLADKSPLVRINAAVELGGEHALRVLTDLLQSEDVDIVAATLDAAIGKILLPESLVIVACMNSSPSVREAAYRIVAAREDIDAKTLLLQSVQDDFAGVRVVAYEGLVRFKEREVLQQGLRDPDVRVRIAVAEALGEMGMTNMADYIKQELKKATPDIVGSGIIAMAQVGDSALIPAFRKLLDEGTEDLRVDAAEALLILDDRTGVDVLRKALQSNDPFVRIHAAEVLTRYDVPETYNQLAAATQDRFVNVAVQAVRALAQHDAQNQKERFTELMNAQNTLLRVVAAAAYLRS